MIIFDGKIDVVVEMRKKEWVARAWGIALGQGFFGFVIFKRRSAELHVHPTTEQPCPLCLGIGIVRNDDGLGSKACPACKGGQDKSNRSVGG